MTPRVILNRPYLLDHILSKCIRQGECLIWQGRPNNGYGRIRVDDHDYYVHRLVALAYCEPFDILDSSIDVCHNCDTPLCCEYTHLVVADAEYNIQEAQSKGRMNRKLTMEQAREIRALYLSIGNCQVLAQKYNVDRAAILHIVQGTTYREDTSYILKQYTRREPHAQADTHEEDEE